MRERISLRYARTEQSAELAAGRINAAEGLLINGERRPLRLIFEDNNALPSGSIGAARRLVRRTGTIRDGAFIA